MYTTAYPVPKPEFKFELSGRKDVLTGWGRYITAQKALGGYNLGTYRPVAGKPYGFVASAVGDVFAYGLGDKPLQVVYNTVDSPKGLRIAEWRHATTDDLKAVDSAYKAKLAELQVALEEQERSWAEARYRLAVEAWEKEKNFFEQYGFYAVSVVKGSKNCYGRANWEDYKFSRAINEEEFVAYLKAMGINLEPERVDAPVCQGEIRISHDGYGDTSSSWRRYESFVYYD